MDRPFSVRYNPYTQSIEVLDTPDRLVRCAKDLRTDLDTLIEALEKQPAPSKNHQ